MQIDRIKISELSLDPANVRKHDRKNLDAIKASLRKFGQQKPIVVDAKGIVIAGNGTMTAAQELGWTEIAAYRTTLTGVEATAFAVADNRSAELAEWSDDLAGVLKSLADADVDLAELGFAQNDLKKISKDFAGITEDEVPEPPAEPITKAGDLWILGDHRVLCGDSTSEDDVGALMAGEKADVVFTDPPYGVNIQGGKNNQTIAGDLSQTAIPFAFDLSVTLATKEDARLYFCGAEVNLHLYHKLFEKFCKQLPRHLIWVKNGFAMKPNGYHNQYEIIYHGYKPTGGGLNKWFGGRTEHEASDVWRISRDPSSTYEHPTQKPVALPCRAIGNSCPPKGLVYEPFGGSGSTFIAAEQLGRKCYGLEISPAYCDVIVKRWENLTGKKAVLENRIT